MIHWFSPAWLKKADRFSKGVKKFIAYHRDLMPADKLADVEAAKLDYDTAMKLKDRKSIEGTGDDKSGGFEGLEKRLLRLCEKAVPNYASGSLKENVEVIIVAIIVALGIRAYYLQPFKIPTASMQPTLNGIIGTRMDADQEGPNFLLKGWQYAWNGRNYVNFEIPKDWPEVKFVGFRQYSRMNFFTFTELHFTNGTQTFSDFVYAPARQVLNDLCWNASVRELKNIPSDDTQGPQPITVGALGLNEKLQPAGDSLQAVFKGGDIFARGYVESGDQLLVDKVSYHFVRPKRDDVFVFNTKNIIGLAKSQHYIKRLVALPGDEVAITEPKLFVNGAEVTAHGSANVIGSKNGFLGYKEAGGYPYAKRRGSEPGTVYDFTSKPGYIALGDNSGNSLDSRYWGTVPEKNLVGPALLVYWPFANHFGIIR